MDFNLSHLLKNKDSLWVSVIFYLLCALLIILIFSYFIITLKVNLQTQKINDIDKRTVTDGIYQQKINEKKVLDYKKKIDGFSLIFSNHKISSDIFNLIEENTLPKIWFSNFDMSQSTNKIKLSGEAEDMETLGRQVQVFEKNKDYIKSTNILDSQVEPSGKIRFTLSLSLDPSIFAYSQK